MLEIARCPRPAAGTGHRCAGRALPRTAPSIDELRRLLGMLGLAPRELMRKGEAEYAELGLDDPSLGDDALIQVMHAHPRLIERPIFINGDRAVVGRPPERVLELLE
nr:ArsC/Spx/MgsR family protein [Lysobacter alkalisoli]